MVRTQKTAAAPRGSQRLKRPAAPRGATAQLPKNQSTETLPSFPAIEWIPQGTGWRCREVFYVNKRRRRRPVGYLGRAEYERMAASGELQAQLAVWIEEHKFNENLAELGGEAEQRPVM